MKPQELIAVAEQIIGVLRKFPEDADVSWFSSYDPSLHISGEAFVKMFAGQIADVRPSTADGDAFYSILVNDINVCSLLRLEDLPTHAIVPDTFVERSKE